MQKYTRTRNRFRSGPSAASRVLTIVLVIAVFAAGFFVSKLTIGGGFNQKDTFKNQLLQQIRSESKNAVTYVNRLSRNNGTSSDFSTIAVIKQNLHCMEILNTMLIACYGDDERVFTSDELDTAILATDEFFNKLQSGTRVTESTDSLTSLVTELYQKVIQLSES